LPTLRVHEDVPKREAPEAEIWNKEEGATQVKWCPQPTNGIVFFRGLTSLPDLPEDLVPYVPLFCNVRGHV
jgi:Zn-dependent M16 (insulinase) family peptidase